MDQTEVKPVVSIEDTPAVREPDEELESEKQVRQDSRVLRPAAATSQSTVITTGLVAQDDAEGEESDLEELTEEERQRRDLNRRPSYRRIVEELKDGTDGKPNPDAIRHIVTTNANAAGVIGSVANFQTTATAMIHDPTSGVQFQVVTNSPVAAAGGGGTATQPSVITFNSPQVRVSGVTTSPATAAQFVTAGQLQRVPASLGTLPAQGVVIQTPNPQQLAEDSTRKREMRLMKNREAAKECRRKKKEYVKCLENRVAVLEAQNKTLIEELKALKDLYCHKSADNP